MDALGRGDLEEGADLGDDVGRAAGSCAAGVPTVLPCIGSVDQIALLPAARVARIRAGSGAAPCRRRSGRSGPAGPAGCPGRAVDQAQQVVGVKVGPHLSPIVLAMPRAYSTWAPSSCRVRSPIQIIWRRGRPPAFGQLVPAGQRLLVIEQQRLMAGEHSTGWAMSPCGVACSKPRPSRRRAARWISERSA